MRFENDFAGLSFRKSRLSFVRILAAGIDRGICSHLLRQRDAILNDVDANDSAPFGLRQQNPAQSNWTQAEDRYRVAFLDPFHTIARAAGGASAEGPAAAAVRVRRLTCLLDPAPGVRRGVPSTLPQAPN